MNSVFLPTFLMEVVVTYRETMLEARLKTFAEKIKDHGTEDTLEDTDMEKYRGFEEDYNKDKTKTIQRKDAMARNPTEKLQPIATKSLHFFRRLH